MLIERFACAYFGCPNTCDGFVCQDHLAKELKSSERRQPKKQFGKYFFTIISLTVLSMGTVFAVVVKYVR